MLRIGSGWLEITRQYLTRAKAARGTHRAKERPEVVLDGRTTGRSSVSIADIVMSSVGRRYMHTGRKDQEMPQALSYEDR